MLRKWVGRRKKEEGRRKVKKESEDRGHFNSVI
jgi:hypothetical protein